MRRHTNWLTAPGSPIGRSATSSARSPPAFAPGGEAGTLRAQCGVVAVAGVDDGGVVVDVEHPCGDVIEQLVEIAGVPSLADPTGKQAVAGEQLGDSAGGRAVERQCDGSRGVSAEMDDVERQVTDLDDVAAGQQAVRLDRQG